MAAFADARLPDRLRALGVARSAGGDVPPNLGIGKETTLNLGSRDPCAASSRFDVLVISQLFDFRALYLV